MSDRRLRQVAYCIKEQAFNPRHFKLCLLSSFSLRLLLIPVPNQTWTTNLIPKTNPDPNSEPHPDSLGHFGRQFLRSCTSVIQSNMSMQLCSSGLFSHTWGLMLETYGHKNLSHTCTHVSVHMWKKSDLMCSDVIMLSFISIPWFVRTFLHVLFCWSVTLTGNVG